MNERKITGLTLISSAVCNLNCSFCFLNKNSSYKDFDHELQLAWQNQTYLKSVIKTLSMLHVNANDISSICLWGGEPLLSIDNLIPSLPELFQYFQYLDEMWTSTNFAININKFINFLQALDKYANKKLVFKLQMSIDGPEGMFTDLGHNVAWEIYKKNFDELTSALNIIKFNNIKLCLSIRSTADEKKYLEYFSNIENLKSYYIKMLELKKYVNDKIINSNNIEWHFPIHYPVPSVPSEATVEDGIKYNEIVQLWNYLRQTEFKDIVESEKVNPFFGIGRNLNLVKYTYSNYECSEIRNRLTIWPDGTIVECGSCFILPYNKYKQFLQNNHEDWALNVANASSHVSYNPSLMTEQEIELQEWLSVTGFKNNHSTQYNLVMGLCDEMAQSGQIEKKYHEHPEILLQHISLIGEASGCTRDNIKTTQIPYLAAPSTYRKFLNGLVDTVLANNEEMIKG